MFSLRLTKLTKSVACVFHIPNLVFTLCTLWASSPKQVQISLPSEFCKSSTYPLIQNSIQDSTCVFIWFPGVRVCLRAIQWDVRTFLFLILSYQWIVVNISENHLRIFVFSGVIPVIFRSLRTVYRHATTIIKVRRTWICSVNEIKKGYIKLDNGYKINLNILIHFHLPVQQRKLILL